MTTRLFLQPGPPQQPQQTPPSMIPADLPPASADGTRELLDRFGRVARDLRVSLTDRCNLRCTYCMPAEGLEWLPTEQALNDEEIIRLIRISVENSASDRSVSPVVNP